jgi:hypothetical protein
VLDERTLSDKSELSDEDQVDEYVPSESGSQFVDHSDSELSDKSELSGEDQDEDSHELGTDPRNANKQGTRKRHKHRTPEEWKRQVVKNKRLKGESYKNVKGKEIQTKVMGPACTSKFCKKSSLRHCPSLSEKQRKDIFDQFWKMNTWEERRLYVHALVDRVWKS